MSNQTVLLVDCGACPVRGEHCADCVVTALEHLPPFAPERRPPAAGKVSGAHPSGGRLDVDAEGLDLDAAEWEVVGRFVRAGLIGREQARLLRAFPDDLASVRGDAVAYARATG